MLKTTFIALFISLGLALSGGCSNGGQTVNDVDESQPGDAGESDTDVAPDPKSIRVATFNASLYREEAGGLIDDLQDPEQEQPGQIAEIIQIKRPDVLLINEFDYDEDLEAATLFAEDFLGADQGNQDSIEYPYFYAFPSNTGIASGHDLDDNGVVGTEEGTEDYAGDAYGYGLFPGQYAFAVFSKFPLDIDGARTFQYFLWDDMPDNLIPPDFYTDEELEIFRLSSKNHVDLPVDIGDHRLHLLASHPTPPAFDGPEQRNVRRNQDEIRLWHDYIRPEHADYLYDDDGIDGGLAEDRYFVIVGDLNADPHDNDEAGAIADLLDSPRTYDPKPASEGGQISGETSGGANQGHEGEHKHDTSQWAPHVGNMRVDYAIPSSNLTVEDSAVFWPHPDDDYADLVTATDHRLVWVDVTLGK